MYRTDTSRRYPASAPWSSRGIVEVTYRLPAGERRVPGALVAIHLVIRVTRPPRRPGGGSASACARRRRDLHVPEAQVRGWTAKKCLETSRFSAPGPRTLAR